MFKPTDALSMVRWLPVVNVNAGDVPPFGVVKRTGWDATQSAWQVDQPGDSEPTSKLLVNGLTILPAGAAGMATRDLPFWAATKPGDTISLDDEIGTIASSWTLGAGQTGFNVWKPPTNDIAVVVTLGGGSELKMVRVTGLPIAAPSGWWYYPGIVQQRFSPTSLWVDTTATLHVDTAGLNGLASSPVLLNCWLVSWYTYIDMIGTDGQSATFALPCPSYDPTNGAADPTDSKPAGVYKLPVYETDHYAAFIAVMCQTTAGGTDTTGLFGG